MAEERWCQRVDREAGERLTVILAKPMSEDRDMISVDDFNPWEAFPALFGSYSSDFDDCALQVLEDIRDGKFTRTDLAAEMFREMLCTANLCDYGTSPRVCFPTREFGALLPSLIEKWKAYYNLQWGEEYTHPTTPIGSE